MKPKRLILASGLALCAQAVLANTVTSAGAACNNTGGRVFSVTANSVVQCLLAGNGNINGSNQNDAAFVASGWAYVDSSDPTAGPGQHDGWLTGAPSLTSGLTGTFSINSLAYATYDRIAIGFKSGEGQLNPDWAIFELADFTFGGSWSISGNQALSHAILYGFGTPGGGGGSNEIPEPGSLALVGLALLGASAARRVRLRR